MFQPKLLNNALCQASQQEAPRTTKRTLANPIIPNFQKGPCCLGPGKVRHASFLFIIKMLFHSEFTSLMVYYLPSTFKNIFFSWLQYF